MFTKILLCRACYKEYGPLDKSIEAAIARGWLVGADRNLVQQYREWCIANCRPFVLVRSDKHGNGKDIRLDMDTVAPAQLNGDELLAMLALLVEVRASGGHGVEGDHADWGNIPEEHAERVARRFVELGERAVLRTNGVEVPELLLPMASLTPWIKRSGRVPGWARKRALLYVSREGA